MLYMIGLGLGDAKDITVKGLEVLRCDSRVYLEAYTSVLTVGKEVLEEFYGRKLILADGEEVEQEADNILKDADISDVAFLVAGDPFGCVADRVLVLWPGIRPVPLRWESRAQDIGPPETSRPHVISNGKALPEISISTLRPSSTQRPASYSAGQPMPNN